MTDFESTEVFILTVLRDNVLDACETFMRQQDALQSGIYFCEMANIDVNRAPSYDSKMKGWMLSDSYGYFVSVVCRSIHNTSYMIGSSYGTFLDVLAGRGFTRRGGGYGVPYNYSLDTATKVLDGYGSIVTHPSAYVAPLAAPQPPPPVQTPPPTPIAVGPTYAPGDDPKELTLPGGFAIDGRPLIMNEVFQNPYQVQLTTFLSEPQKWALVLARTKHRPKQVIVIKGVGCWSQHYMLQELTKQTPLGKQMRDQELAEISEIYIEAHDMHDEESSSSSEEEDYD